MKMPVDDFALGVVGEREVRSDLQRKIAQRPRLRLRAGRGADIVCRRRKTHVLRARSPPCVPVDVEIDAARVRLPERKVRSPIHDAKPFPLLPAHCLRALLHEQRAVRIDERHDPDSARHQPSSHMLHGKIRRHPFARMHGIRRDADGAGMRTDKQRKQIAPLGALPDNALFAAIAPVKCFDILIDVHRPLYAARRDLRHAMDVTCGTLPPR